MSEENTISLTAWCQEHGLSKTTVHRRCKELQISTSQGLTTGAIRILCKELGIPPAPDPTPTPIEVIPEDFVRTTVLAPYESREIQLPEGFDPSAMIQLFDGITAQATDTSTLLGIADLAISAVGAAMDAKLQEQRQKLSQSEQDAAALEKKVSEAKTDMKVKALEAKMLSERQSQATSSVTTRFAELMAMGKPSEPQQSPPPSSTG